MNEELRTATQEDVAKMDLVIKCMIEICHMFSPGIVEKTCSQKDVNLLFSALFSTTATLADHLGCTVGVAKNMRDLAHHMDQGTLDRISVGHLLSGETIQ